MQTKRKTLPKRFTGSSKKKSYGFGGAVMSGVNSFMNKEKILPSLFKAFKAGVTPGSGVQQGLKLGSTVAGKLGKDKLSQGLNLAGGLSGGLTGGGGGGFLSSLSKGTGGQGFQKLMQGWGKTAAANGMKVLKSYHEGGGIPHQHGTDGSITNEHEDTDRTEGSNIYSAENNVNPNTGDVMPTRQQKEIGKMLRGEMKDYMKSVGLNPNGHARLLDMHRAGEINLKEVPAFQNIVELSTAGWSPEAKERYTDAITSNILGGNGWVHLPYIGLQADEKSFMKDTKNRDFSEGLTFRDAGKTGVTLGGGQGELRKSDRVRPEASQSWTYTEGMKEKYNPGMNPIDPRQANEISTDTDRELMEGPPPGERHGYGEDPIPEFHGYGEDDPEPDPEPDGGLGEYDLGLRDLDPSDYTGSTADQSATGPWSGETRDPRMQGMRLLKEGETQEDGGAVYAHGGRIPNHMLRQMLKKDTYRLRRRR